MEYGLGAELGLIAGLRISAGWLATATGVNDAYQSDQTYSTNTNSFGAGIGLKITDLIQFNLGGQYTIYADDTKNFSHLLGGTLPLPVTETYAKNTWLIGAGVDFHFGL